MPLPFVSQYDLGELDPVVLEEVFASPCYTALPPESDAELDVAGGGLYIDPEEGYYLRFDFGAGVVLVKQSPVTVACGEGSASGSRTPARLCGLSPPRRGGPS